MRKTILLSLILLVSAAWAVAQYDQSAPSGQTSSPNASVSHQTIEGCLSESNGNYVLTDKSGNAYQLTGDTAKLRDHVGHEIRVRGMVSSPEASSAGTQTGAASGEANQRTINVTSFKHISSSCQQ